MKLKFYDDIYYFQFKDILRYAQVGENGTLSSTPVLNIYADQSSANNYFCSFGGGILLYSKFNKIKDTNTGILKSLFKSETDEARTLLYKYILPNMWNKYVVRSKNDETPFHSNIETTELDTNEEVENFFLKSESFIEETYDYYKKLIDLYEAKKNALLDKLESHNVIKFNDMPQTAAVATDDHLTNITDTTLDQDVSTAMERLREVQDNLKRIYSDWAKEYEERFAIVLGE